MSPRSQLVALHEKYELLLDLHRAKPERSVARRQSMSEIAARFPGALREWQALPEAELLRRRDCLRSWLQADGIPAELPTWVDYSLDLHAWLRLILALRKQLYRTAHIATGPDDATTAATRLATAQRLCNELGESTLLAAVTPALLSQIDKPPGGQLAAIAYAHIAAQHQVSVATVKAVLFQAAAAHPGR